MAKALRITSDLAILDVKHGRGQLGRLLAGVNPRLGPSEMGIAVTIHGCLTNSCSQDDGESEEFAIEVTQIEIPTGEVEQIRSPDSDIGSPHAPHAG